MHAPSSRTSCRFACCSVVAHFVPPAAGGSACLMSGLRPMAAGAFYGLYLLVEVVDGQFLRRNRLDPSGLLFKGTRPPPAAAAAAAAAGAAYCLAAASKS